MSDKANERPDKMSVEYVNEAKGMADFILRAVHRGPGDTVDAAMHRAERAFGAPAKWLHRLRYRDLNDLPVSAFFAILNAYRAAHEAGSAAYEHEKALADARNSKMAGLAALVAGAENEGAVK
jgi:hypothetical protein